MLNQSQGKGPDRGLEVKAEKGQRGLSQEGGIIELKILVNFVVKFFVQNMNDFKINCYFFYLHDY